MAPATDIGVVSWVLFPALAGQSLAFNEFIDWLQFLFMGNRAGTYVAPSSTDLGKLWLVEGGDLFMPDLCHLQRRLPGAYAPLTMYTLNKDMVGAQIHSPTGGLLRVLVLRWEN